MHPLTARQPKKVLMVEDDDTSAYLTKRMLETVPPGEPGPSHTSKCIYGTWIVSWAENLAAATDLLRHNSFDVILLDMILPDGTREDAVRVIREASPDLPIVVYSNLTDGKLVKRLLLVEGVSDYIVKGDITSPCALKQRLCHEIDRFHVVRDVDLEEATNANATNAAV